MLFWFVNLLRNACTCVEIGEKCTWIRFVCKASFLLLYRLIYVPEKHVNGCNTHLSLTCVLIQMENRPEFVGKIDAKALERFALAEVRCFYSVFSGR